MIRLHIDTDHVTAIRNARGAGCPEPVAASAMICELAGAEGIAAHMHEDPRSAIDRGQSRPAAVRS